MGRVSYRLCTGVILTDTKCKMAAPVDLAAAKKNLSEFLGDDMKKYLLAVLLFYIKS